MFNKFRNLSKNFLQRDTHNPHQDCKNASKIISYSDFCFSFNPDKCSECGGKCCYGESGYIFASVAELQAMASFLKIDFEDFCLKYVRKVGTRYSLIEKSCIDKSMGVACIFFDEDTKICSIYSVRPKQCRTFPFWNYYKDKKDEIKGRCIGII